MLISAWDIYWITRLDAIKDLCFIITLFGGSLGLISLALVIFENPPALLRKVTKTMLTLAAVGAVGMCILPSTRVAAAMVVLPAIVNSQAVQKLPAELTSLATDWLHDLRSENRKE